MGHKISIYFTLMLFSASFAFAQEKNPNMPPSLPAKKVTSTATTSEEVATPDMVDPTLLNTYSKELYEIKKTEEAERNAVWERESTDKLEADYQQQIKLRKAKIENFKARQEQINSDIQAMKDEVADYQKKFDMVQGQYGDAEQRHEDFLASLDKEKANLEQLKTKYEVALDKLTERHERTKRAIAATMALNHQSKTELANQMTSIQGLEAKVAEAQADEMKSKAEWMALKAQIEDQKGEKNKKAAMLAEAEKKYQAALGAQHTAQNELFVVQKNLADYSRKVAEEVRRYEDSSMQAQKAKIVADTNKMKAEAEAERLKTYVSLVKRSNNEMMTAQRDSEDGYRGAQLAIEAARSELSINLAGSEQFSLRKVKRDAEIRNIASVDSSNSILDGGKTWVIKTNCQMRERARSASEAIGEVTPGQRLPATAGPGQWVTTLSGGKKAYIRTECGAFE